MKKMIYIMLSLTIGIAQAQYVNKNMNSDSTSIIPNSQMFNGSGNAQTYVSPTYTVPQQQVQPTTPALSGVMVELCGHYYPIEQAQYLNQSALLGCRGS